MGKLSKYVETLKVYQIFCTSCYSKLRVWEGSKSDFENKLEAEGWVEFTDKEGVTGCICKNCIPRKRKVKK